METLVSNSGVEVFNTELLQLDISAGGILIRESPTLSADRSGFRRAGRGPADRR